ncbi:MAG: hypothetical protein ACRD28_07350 [Acidobacteriaceae bacterium]
MGPVAYAISLTAIGILTGLAILPVFARFSDTDGLSLAKRKIRAALYEFRLFGDEPRLVFRAQLQLLLWNVRYLGLILKPAAVVIVPVVILMAMMDTVYGHRALNVGENTLVTAQMADGVDLNAISPQLTGTNVAIETPSVRMPGLHQVVWGVRTTGVGRDRLFFSAPGNGADPTTVATAIDAGPGVRMISERRVGSIWEWLVYPGQRLLPHNGPFQWVAIQYPDAEVDLFGFGIPWIVWFIAVSWITVFALRKRFGVII